MNRSQRGWLVGAIGFGMVVAGVWLLVPDWKVRLGLEPAPEVTAEAEAAPGATAAQDEPVLAEDTQTAADSGAAGEQASAADGAGAPPTGAPAADAGIAAGDAAETAAGAVADATPGTESPIPEAEAGAAEPEVALAPAGAEAEPAASGAEAPAFDLVRVDSEGEAVIAGTTRPGAEVELLMDGVVIAGAVAGRDGSFVVIASLGRSDRARALQLRNAGEEASAAVAEAAVELVGAEEAEGAGAEAGEAQADAATATAEGEGAEGATVALAAPESDTEGRPAPSASGLSAPVVILPSESASEAPLVVAPSSETVALLQPAPTDVGRVVLDRITYTSEGEAVAAGRARPGHAVRAYANAEFVADSPVSASGDWQVALPRAVAETAVLLRFDEVSASGEVTSRLETPFSYDDGAGAVASRQRRIVVQRGDNLWRIAEQHYGAGIRYSVIYSANSGLIRDPDLIYPGQVFAIPELVAAE